VIEQDSDEFMGAKAVAMRLGFPRTAQGASHRPFWRRSEIEAWVAAYEEKHAVRLPLPIYEVSE
jgi:hypothetical protein